MPTQYHRYWNYTTNTIAIPPEYQNPFNTSKLDEDCNPERLPTSLEILQNVLHDEKYRDEFARVEEYMAGKTDQLPRCLKPDLQATRKLAQRVVDARKLQGNQSPGKLTLPVPIINVGYSKVGSTSITRFFKCSGWRANHGFKLGCGKKKMFAKQTMIDEEMIGKKTIAFTELNHNFGWGCWPQIQMLDEMHDSAPQSTFIFIFRPIHDWLKSMVEWSPGVPSMFNRTKGWKVPGLPFRDYNPGTKESQKVNLAKFWCSHTLHMREYVKEYPSHALIELDLYDNDGTKSLLFDLFQADARANRRKKRCWGKANSHANTTNALRVRSKKKKKNGRGA